MKNKYVLKKLVSNATFKNRTYFGESITWFSETNALDLLLLSDGCIISHSNKYTKLPNEDA